MIKGQYSTRTYGVHALIEGPLSWITLLVAVEDGNIRET